LIDKPQIPQNLFHQTQLRQRLYQGEIKTVMPTNASLNLVDVTCRFLKNTIGKDFRKMHLNYSNQEYLALMTSVRDQLADQAIQTLTWDILEEIGLSTREYAVDQVRLRAIVPNAHKIQAALSVYVAHRDTWYCNSQAQINCWIPLHDIKQSDGFEIFPSYLSSQVKNSSADFNYEEFKQEAGWQKSKTDKKFYPSLLQDIDEKASHSVFGKQGELHLFSAAHLHRTRKMNSDKVRFSLDFRFVHLLDHENEIGAPNVDNESLGSTLDDYFQLS